MATDSYLKHSENLDKGLLYLHTYGLLQALVLRHDALRKFCAILGSNRMDGDFSGLSAAREIRVDVAGHPISHNMKTQEGPHFLIQMGLQHGSLEVMTMTSQDHKFKMVSLDGLIRDQEENLVTILSGVIQDMESDDDKHRAPFKGRKLEAVFPDTLGYCFEKIHEGISSKAAAPLAIWGIESVKKAMVDYKSGLEERGIQLGTYDAINYYYELLQYPVCQLEAYLRDQKSQLSCEKDADIFTFFIQEYLKKLREMARETDEEFES